MKAYKPVRALLAAMAATSLGACSNKYVVDAGPSLSAMPSQKLSDAPETGALPTIKASNVGIGFGFMGFNFGGVTPRDIGLGE